LLYEALFGSKIWEVILKDLLEKHIDNIANEKVSHNAFISINHRPES
jgi:hypothetical protein